MMWGKKGFWLTVKDSLISSFLPIYSIPKQIELTKLQIQSSYELQVTNQQFILDIKRTETKFWNWIEQKKSMNPLSLQEREIQPGLFHWQLRWAMMNARLTKYTELFSEMWDNLPLKGMTALTVLDSYDVHQNHSTPIPLLVILSAPRFDKKFTQLYELPKIENDLTEEVRNFLNQHYSIRSQTPIKFFESAWHIKNFSGEVAFDNLFYLLKYVPVLVLEPEISAHVLNLRIAVWDIGHSEYHQYSILSGFNYKNLINRISRVQTLRWKERKEVLLEKGLSLHMLKQANKEIGIYERNLTLLHIQEQSEAIGESLNVDYIPSQICYDEFKRYLRLLHCLIIGLTSDEYFFYHYHIVPQFPSLFLELTREFSGEEFDELAEIVVLHYQNFCEQFISSFSFDHDLAIELARQFSHWPRKQWAKNQLQYALRLWLRQRGVTMESTTLEDYFQAMPSHLKLVDAGFFTKVQQCLSALAHESPSFTALLTKLDELNVQQQQQIKVRQEEVLKTMAQIKKLRPKELFRDMLRRDIEGPKMVVIPAGKFRMGDRKGGGSESEKPVHEVNIHDVFAIGQTPITFLEYDQFCQMSGKAFPYDNDWGRGNRPVINVTWQDAKAYCQWLSEETEKTYRLPSEAEWEYICRAGVTADSSPFIESIKWAWFEQSLVGKTHPVGRTPPNPWDIYDLQGNVWEWCEDRWHHDYQSAPTDGKAWVEGGEPMVRVVRGGLLLSAVQGGCCCASRYYSTTASPYIGFRVVREIK